MQLLRFTILIILFSSFTGVFALLSEAAFRLEFHSFKSKFQKLYHPHEEEVRYSIFKKNLELIHEKNKRDPHAVYDLNKFSDLTPMEFKQIVLMGIPSNDTAHSVLLTEKRSSLPDDFDWKFKGVVTEVKDQGLCGSCWDFSITETIESVCALAGYPMTKLSEQQILDCDSSNYGCNGGWPTNAYEYVIKAGGLVSEEAYPYLAKEGMCKFNSSDVKCKISDWKYVTRSKDEDSMQSFLYENSPLSVCVDAELWQHYKEGVISASSGCGNSLNHCVQVTGWSKKQGMTVWNVRNSWGTDWGESGYIYVQKGSNICSISELVTVPCVKNKTGKLVC